MTHDIEGTVLITGASRGLGAALALEFARAGASVAICARGEDDLERIADRIRADGGSCLTAALDITDEGAVAGWVADAARELGPPGVLINNASMLGPRVALAEHAPEAWRRTLEVNLTGTFLTTRAVLPYMRRTGRGSIINVSSGAAIPPRANWGAYSVSKQAVETFTYNLAAELDGTGVRANIVDPGAMRTEMRAEAYPSENPTDVQDPAAVAPVFLWLAGRDSDGVSGERFQADDFVER
jgi:NAD(P)-dependent dehydrogenase (short-subunit alcohol dehydrogenase family)